MTTPRARPTTRGIAVLVGLTLVVGVVTVVLIQRLTGPDCTVRTGARTVRLDRAQAEAAATAVADVVRRSGSAEDARAAVEAKVDLVGVGAKVVADALSGRDRAAFSCSYGGSGSSESDQLSSEGLTQRAEAVRADMAAHFGDLPLGGFAPGGVTSGHMPGSAHYEGRAIDVFFRPISPRNKTRGWALAQYLVAHAERLEINTVIFDAKIWTARKGGDGWREFTVDAGDRPRDVVRILEHRDHVHVDVAD